GGSVIDWQPGAAGSLLVMRSHVPDANRQSASLIVKDEAGMGIDLMDASGGSVRLDEKPHRDAIEYITDGRGKVRVMGTHAAAGQTGILSGLIRYFFKAEGGSDWQSLSTLDIRTREGFVPVAVDAATNRAIGFAKMDGRHAV